MSQICLPSSSPISRVYLPSSLPLEANDRVVAFSEILEREFRIMLKSSWNRGIPRRRGIRQGTKHRQTQVDAEDLLQAQIIGETAAIKTVEPALGRGKRVKISKK